MRHRDGSVDPSAEKYTSSTHSHALTLVRGGTDSVDPQPNL